MIHNEHIGKEPQEVALKRSQRERIPVISNDYMVYLHETEIDLRFINRIELFQLLFMVVISSSCYFN